MADYKDGLGLIPRHMRDGVTRYIEQGIPGGSFLTAVMENNLVQAYNRADESNTEAMHGWAAFLYGYLPTNAWGSPEKVAAWIAHGGLQVSG